MSNHANKRYTSIAKHIALAKTKDKELMVCAFCEVIIDRTHFRLELEKKGGEMMRKL